MGLREQAESLATVQETFAEEQGIKLYGEVDRDGKLVGSEAICHNKVIEEIALPGPGRRRHRLAHLHGRRARLLRVRRRLDRHGQRLVHAGRARHGARDRRASSSRDAARRASAPRT